MKETISKIPVNDKRNTHIDCKSDTIPIKFSYFLIRKIFGPIVKLIWVKKVTGLHNIPLKGPVLVAFNHQSYFDFICFIAISPRNVHYLSAEKFFTNALWLPLMRITGQIEVKRTSKDKREVHNLVNEHLRRGFMIGIFPEGTRNPDETQMLKAFTGVAKYASLNCIPVIPVGIKHAEKVMNRYDKKPKFKKIIEFHIGDPIHFHPYTDRAKLNKKSIRTLTTKIMLRIEKLSGKPYPHREKWETITA
ncbi:TPA: hypothetical protein DCZ46_03040 [Candidatus Campbellbacteria bacterium]|nr:MAG: 1-acyl-sn-glycerol-3-phosphate acyltransferase, 1-acyl-sn-glycerol-3-phosphate acyltransferase [Candidatus Campbellbacteria bacterium GW2011_OD1_34_28]KKP74896.1 MAG: 1-acylglycerol-3-phosphate O-acyltransferase [Candidatus Campbellbacteria bacterium GW2011_GWD2_35_24]KKP75782.1 MAG: 1-acyl-sn-glycerol-3-phosphate acyltransferase, 1-acyl-sn-glycerol-3-phosphate acyltransferase [Candidatus Campbellbacteria bacterium GW2011_GWC2_35_28]KKP76970.1 MAG: 1-acyl-sn-glycerol-3-phosphate acyltran